MMPWRAALPALLAMLVAWPARADESARPQVLASIRPLALITRALAEGELEVRTLPGVDVAPHDFVLRPSALRSLREAALFLWMGPALERPLERVLARDPEIRALALLPSGAPGATPDPHVWLDPREAAAIARRISTGLRERGLLDASRADAALARFEQAMQSREAAIVAEFAGLQDVPFVVMHDGLGVFAARFGLAQAGALPTTHEQQPGARSLAGLRRTAIARDARCLFRGPGDSESLARTLAEGTRMRIVELDTLALHAPDTAQGFDAFLQTLAQAVAGCLRAAPEESS